MVFCFRVPFHDSCHHCHVSVFSGSRLGVSLFRPAVVDQFNVLSVIRQATRGATSAQAQHEQAVAGLDRDAVNASQQNQTPVPIPKRPNSPFQPNNKAEFVMARVDDLMAWARKVTPN